MIPDLYHLQNYKLRFIQACTCSRRCGEGGGWDGGWCTVGVVAMITYLR